MGRTLPTVRAVIVLDFLKHPQANALLDAERTNTTMPRIKTVTDVTGSVMDAMDLTMEIALLVLLPRSWSQLAPAEITVTQANTTTEASANVNS